MNTWLLRSMRTSMILKVRSHPLLSEAASLLHVLPSIYFSKHRIHQARRGRYARDPEERSEEQVSRFPFFLLYLCRYLTRLLVEQPRYQTHRHNFKLRSGNHPHLRSAYLQRSGLERAIDQGNPRTRETSASDDEVQGLKDVGRESCVEIL